MYITFLVDGLGQYCIQWSCILVKTRGQFYSHWYKLHKEKNPMTVLYSMVMYIWNKNVMTAIVTKCPLISFIVALRLTQEFTLQYFYALLKLPFSGMYMKIFYFFDISLVNNCIDIRPQVHALVINRLDFCNSLYIGLPKSKINASKGWWAMPRDLFLEYQRMNTLPRTWRNCTGYQWKTE